MHDPWFSPEQFWERLVDIYAKTRDFDLVTGWIDDTVVGYAFGSPRDNDDLWTNIIRTYPDMTPKGSVYIFREFAVSPDWQRLHSLSAAQLRVGMDHASGAWSAARLIPAF
jgi:hypothetical protein